MRLESIHLYDQIGTSLDRKTCSGLSVLTPNQSKTCTVYHNAADYTTGNLPSRVYAWYRDAKNSTTGNRVDAVDNAFVRIVEPSLSGTVWLDSNKDGIRQSTETGRIAGVIVSLLNEDGEEVDVVSTNSSGYYIFQADYPTAKYQAKFDFSNATINGQRQTFNPSPRIGETNENDMEADFSTRFYSLDYGMSENADSGVWVVQPSVSSSINYTVDRGTKPSNNILPLLEDGKTSSSKITVSYTNNGSEDLRGISITNNTSGVSASSPVCSVNGVLVSSSSILRTGQTMTCEIAVPSLSPNQSHTSNVRISASGASTGQALTDSQSITFRAPTGTPALTVKKYVNDEAHGVGHPKNKVKGSTKESDAQTTAGSVRVDGTFNTTYTVKNDGNVDLTDVQIYNIVGGERIPVECNFTTLGAGKSAVCHSTQSSEFIESSEPVNTPALATASYMNLETDSTMGLTSNADNAYVNVVFEGNVQVQIFYATEENISCVEASNSCIPVDGVPVGIGKVQKDTDDSGTVVGNYISGLEETLSVDLAEILNWAKIQSVMLDNTNQNNVIPETVSITPNETRTLSITLVSNATGEGAKDGTPTIPVFDSGM